MDLHESGKLLRATVLERPPNMWVLPPETPPVLTVKSQERIRHWCCKTVGPSTFSSLHLLG